MSNVCPVVSWRISKNKQHTVLQGCSEGNLEMKTLKIKVHVKSKQGTRRHAVNCSLAGTWTSLGDFRRL